MTDANWTRVAHVAEIAPGTGIEVTAEGRVLAVYNVNGEIHVTEGICPHAGGPLGKGTLTESVVTCPWHGWQFDVCTGRHMLSEQIKVPCFPAKVEGDEIFVQLNPA